MLSMQSAPSATAMPRNSSSPPLRKRTKKCMTLSKEIRQKCPSSQDNGNLSLNQQAARVEIQRDEANCPGSGRSCQQNFAQPALTYQVSYIYLYSVTTKILKLENNHVDSLRSFSNARRSRVMERNSSSK